MAQPKGKVVTRTIESEVLKNNLVGMDTNRPLLVYEPPKELTAGKDLPTLYCLAAWTGAGRAMMQWSCFREPLNERLDRLILTEKMPPCLVVCPDLYTDFGGSQYINSDYMGRHGDHVVEEVIPYVEKEFAAKKGAAHRGVFGISSGGYGALRFVMDYDDAFAASACHSGDLGFEILYGSDLTTLANGLARYKGDVEAYRQACSLRPKMAGQDIHIHMLLGMAGFYSPNKESGLGYDLPVDLYSCVKRKEVWDQWLRHDPIERLRERGDVLARLKKLSLLYVECGWKDQYQLHFGARQFDALLKEKGVAHQYTEFEDNHSGLVYRFDTSLPLLAAAVS